MDDGLILSGMVLKVERVQGTTGAGRNYDFFTVHVLADVAVYECTVSRDWKGPLPAKGEHGVFRVGVRAYKRGGDGMAVLGVDLLEKLAESDAPARALESVG